MVLAAALWWLYFDAAAEINLKVLELSGGSPTMARAIFAVGHMLPAFALLLIAAGRRAAAGGGPAADAYWLPASGIGIYLAGTRVFLGGPAAASPGPGRAAGGDVQLGRLARRSLSPREYMWLVMAGP